MLLLPGCQASRDHRAAILLQCGRPAAMQAYRQTVESEGNTNVGLVNVAWEAFRSAAFAPLGGHRVIYLAIFSNATNCGLADVCI